MMQPYDAKKVDTSCAAPSLENQQLSQQQQPLKFPPEAIEPLLASYVDCWFGERPGKESTNSRRDPLLIQAVKNNDEASVFMFLLPEFTASNTSTTSLTANGRQLQQEIVVDRSGYTPLHWSAQKGLITITNLLLENYGCNQMLHFQSKYGRTPLHLAALYSQEDVVQLLLKAGANMNIKDMDGHTPLFEAIKSGNEQLVSLLIRNGGDITLPDKYNRTPLFIATDLGKDNIVRLLIDQVLHSEQQQQQQQRNQILEEEGVASSTTTCDAVINMKDTENGQTPLHVAASRGFASIVELLYTKYGANNLIADKYGITPIQVARARGHTSIVHILS